MAKTKADFDEFEKRDIKVEFLLLLLSLSLSRPISVFLSFFSLPFENHCFAPCLLYFLFSFFVCSVFDFLPPFQIHKPFSICT